MKNQFTFFMVSFLVASYSASAIVGQIDGWYSWLPRYTPSAQIRLVWTANSDFEFDLGELSNSISEPELQPDNHQETYKHVPLRILPTRGSDGPISLVALLERNRDWCKDFDTKFEEFKTILDRSSHTYYVSSQ